MHTPPRCQTLTLLNPRALVHDITQGPCPSIFFKSSSVLGAGFVGWFGSRPVFFKEFGSTLAGLGFRVGYRA